MSMFLHIVIIVTTCALTWADQRSGHSGRNVAAIGSGGGVVLSSDEAVVNSSLSEVAADTATQSGNYPMYICNSICAQCANGDIVFVRRAMSWKHLALRAGFEATMASLSTVAAVSGVGTVVAYGLTAASEAASRRIGVDALPNECRAVTALRANKNLNLENREMAYHINVAEVTSEDYVSSPLLKLYMKNMNVIAQKEKDATTKVSWKDWAKRVAGVEQVYEKPGEVPELIEALTGEYFCGGDAGGLMEVLSDGGDNETDDNDTDTKANLTQVRYIPMKINDSKVLFEVDGGYRVDTGLLGGNYSLSYRRSMNDEDRDLIGAVVHGQVIHGIVQNNSELEWLKMELFMPPKVIEQESSWSAFRRNVRTVGGLGKATKGERLQALKQCHVVADKVGLAPTESEQREDEAAAVAFEEKQGGMNGSVAPDLHDELPAVSSNSSNGNSSLSQRKTLVRRQVRDSR